MKEEVQNIKEMVSIMNMFSGINSYIIDYPTKATNPIPIPPAIDLIIIN